ncbi:MAG: aminotransferase class V-fold PLP-dependent enzyme [Sulfurospirillaceae bacterium]|nr:aminotransferase class V-fold PLP-dependent enzyme [Sulfurospirillaceae bacterium]
MEKHSIDWETLRKDIPACEQFVYLNTAGQGPVSRSASNGGKSYYEESLQYGNTLWDKWSDKIVKTREDIAKFVGGNSNEIAFLPNSSLGMNYIAEILDNVGDVLMRSDEFPSCSLPWLQHGYNVKFIDVESDGKTTVDQFNSAITPSIKIIVISHVQFTTGFRQNLEELGALCKSLGIHLVVDASQSAGAFNIDVCSANIDFLVFTGYKWLNAGCGIAGFFINKKFHDSSKFPAVGWQSASDPSKLLNNRLVIANNAKALELGHPQFPNILALGGAIDTLNKIGIDNISERIHHLSNYLRRQLQNHNIQILSPLEQENRSGITSFAVPNASNIVGSLKAKNIIVAKRGEGVRVSLHYYNNHNDIDRFIAALNEIKNSGDR